MNRDLFGGGPSTSRLPESRIQRAGPAAEGVRPLSVTRLNALARRLLETSYPPLWVSGEVTGWKRGRGGHCYFTLRDKLAQIRCVMFQSDADRLPVTPDEGMEVRVLGSLTLYEQRGDFQFKVKLLEGAGADGLWRLAFERLHAKLEAEGVLSAERKRALPRFPTRVGVVTSPFGAALHDILHVLEQRAPWTRVIFVPARVQGEGAARDLARAIQLVSRSQAVDVLIVGRGGGSTEDLWAFNEEGVARAIASCRVPVVSAVGHEVDITIADLVADARAPTPSAAAERVVPDGAFIRRELKHSTERMSNAWQRRVRGARMQMDDCELELVRLTRLLVQRRTDHLVRLADMLDALSPLAALRRGYAVPQNAQGRVLRRVRDFGQDERFQLRVTDGAVECRVAQAREVSS
jgi:exodeoxyribonuclease VII large subunit